MSGLSCLCEAPPCKRLRKGFVAFLEVYMVNTGPTFYQRMSAAASCWLVQSALPFESQYHAHFYGVARSATTNHWIVATSFNARSGRRGSGAGS